MSDLTRPPQLPAVARRAGALALWLLLGLTGACSTLSPTGPQAASGEAPAAAGEVAAEPQDTGNGAGPAEAEVRKKAGNYRFEVEGPEAIAKQILEESFVGRWRRRDDYDPSQFDGLVASLDKDAQAVLRSQGYYSGRTETELLPDGVRLKVFAGPRTTVNRVDLKLTGSGDLNEQAREYALSQWALPEGSFFQSSLWQQGKRRLIDSLNQQGFLRARIVDSTASIKRELTAASLTINIDSGPRIAFGQHTVEGLERYDQRVIDDLRPYKVGDPYTLDVLLLFQARIRSSGYFDEVFVLPDLNELAANPEATRVNLKIKVGEKLTKRAALGIGYSTDEGVRGQIGLEHRDLFNRDWRLESAVVLSQKRQTAFANVRTPFDADNNFVGFGSRLSREDIEGQTSTLSNSYIGLGRREGITESFLSVQYQTESVRLAPGLDEPGSYEESHALVLGYSWNRRSVDSAIDPRRGYTINAQVSGAREGLFTTRSFVRFYGRIVKYFPLPASLAGNDDGVFIVRGEMGVVSAGSREDIPSENLFRTWRLADDPRLPVPVAGRARCRRDRQGVTWRWAASSTSTG
ncbi:MAG: POTRA domain-containing protein [Burkholderiaceae bacterium]